MQELDSSNVLGYDYDRRTRELVVTFIGGRKYIQKNVSGQRFGAFMRASSLGAYVNEHFKNMKPVKAK